MIQVRKSSERGNTRTGWLNSYHSFSFGHYYEPEHSGFGPLVVLNDDFVKAGTGFGTHGHRDMEIVTYVLKGTLAHQDSTGGTGTIESGEVQRMTAGTGIRHSEHNHSKDEDVHFLQIWFHPNRLNLEPGYEQKKFSQAARLNKWLPVASSDKAADGVFINQDVVMYVSRLEKGMALDYPLKDNRGGYIFIIEGDLAANGQRLSTGDALKLIDEPELHLTAEADTELVFFDLPLLEVPAEVAE